MKCRICGDAAVPTAEFGVVDNSLCRQCAADFRSRYEDEKAHDADAMRHEIDGDVYRDQEEP